MAIMGACKRFVVEYARVLALGAAIALCVFCYVGFFEAGFDYFLEGRFFRFERALRNWKRLVFLLFFSELVVILVKTRGAQLGRALFTYRWPIALVVLAACVVFELSGSSIGLLIDYIGGDPVVHLGFSRIDRTDEWTIYTPMSISQCITDGGVFAYFQDSMRAVETDMFCIYGQPVWDIAVLFRPFHWGYLLFGASKGLSFFWCGRLIMLFMVSFEFAYRVIAKGSKPLSVGYASLVAFSVLVQWWFSINSLVEMLLFGQLALIWMVCYLDTSSYKVRLACSVGIAWCLSVFVLSLYPAWQISFGYVFLALLVGLLITKLPQARKSPVDLLLILMVLAIVAAVIAYVFLYRSWETIQIEFNTAYPGDRTFAGANLPYAPLMYPLSLVVPIASMGVFPNPSEIVSFFSFFPLSLLLPCAIMVCRRRVEPVFILLIAVCLFLEWYVMFGFSEEFAKLTLMSRTSHRASSAADFAFLVLMFAALRQRSCLRPRVLVALCLVSVLVLLLGILAVTNNVGPARGTYAMVLAAFIISIVAYLWYKNFYPAMAVLFIVVALMGGAFVNPVRGGIDTYFETDLARCVTASDDNEVFAVTDSSFYLNNVPASLGRKTLNSTNVYPQLETWRKLDPEGSYEEVYNRYATILVGLKESGDPEFELMAADVFSVNLSPEDLKKLGVTRILSESDYAGMDGVVLENRVGKFFMYALE